MFLFLSSSTRYTNLHGLSCMRSPIISLESCQSLSLMSGMIRGVRVNDALVLPYFESCSGPVY